MNIGFAMAVLNAIPFEPANGMEPFASISTPQLWQLFKTSPRRMQRHLCALHKNGFVKLVGPSAEKPKRWIRVRGRSPYSHELYSEHPYVDDLPDRVMAALEILQPAAYITLSAVIFGTGNWMVLSRAMESMEKDGFIEEKDGLWRIVQ